MLPILMYHGLHEGPHSHGRYDPVYSVHPDEFARQLDWLAAHGFQAVRLDDAAASLAAGNRPVVVTFDDGDASNCEVALPLLQARGMYAEFFVTSDFVGQDGMLQPAQVKTLADAGMGIGAHGRSHRFLEDLEAGEMLAELRDSRNVLQDIGIDRIDAIALPGGRGGRRERKAALEVGYRFLLGSAPGPNRRPRPGQWLQRLAITRDMPLERFADLVRWQGAGPRIATARFHALRIPKILLGNRNYQRLRERLL
ncbi:MAG: polysaccharide deacetylase family protein [Pseudoxanthomonas sp.]